MKDKQRQRIRQYKKHHRADKQNSSPEQGRPIGHIEKQRGNTDSTEQGNYQKYDTFFLSAQIKQRNEHCPHKKTYTDS